VSVGGSFGGLNEPSFRVLNPHGRVPVLQDGDTAIWESHTIVRYLAARYGDGSLWPADPLARAQMDEWMDWAQTAFQPDFLNGVFWGYFRTPEAQRNWPAIHDSVKRCSRHIERIDAILAGRPFLAGNFSLADIPLGTLLYRYYELDIEHRYLEIGMRRAQQGIPLSELIQAIVLTKENLWDFLKSEAVMDRAVEIMGELELLQMLEMFFDRAIYYASVGYEEAVARGAHEDALRAS